MANEQDETDSIESNTSSAQSTVGLPAVPVSPMPLHLAPLDFDQVAAVTGVVVGTSASPTSPATCTHSRASSSAHKYRLHFKDDVLGLPVSGIDGSSTPSLHGHESALAGRPMTIAFRDLGYVVPASRRCFRMGQRPAEKVILQPFSGCMRPGELWAVMGGFSTLF